MSAYVMMAYEYRVALADSGGERAVRSAVVLAMVEGALLGYTQRGAVYGVMPGLFIAGLASFMVMLAVRWSRWRTRILHPASVVGLFVVLQVAIAGAVYGLLRPPTAVSVIRKYATADGVRIENPEIFCGWGRDPIYIVKFTTDEMGLERIVEAVHGIEEIPPRSARRDLGIYMRGSAETPRLIVPSWWTIHDIANPRTWRGKSPAGPPVRLRYDTQRNELYLEIIFL